MEIIYKDSFKKSYKKRFQGQKKIEKIIKTRIFLFLQNPKNPQLKTHSLKGSRKGYFSFSITGDIRLIYYIFNGEIYFVDIGTHNQVY